MTSTTRGALPPALYWRRRLFVVGVLLALGLIVVNVVSGTSDPEAGVRATTAGADRVDQTGVGDGAETSTVGPNAARKGRKGKQGRKESTTNTQAPPGLTGPTVALPTAPVLAEPEGECAEDDISVTPTVANPVAGQSATIVLKLRTITSEACTWLVSAESLAVRISVGDDEIWASRHCPAQVPVRSVVVRRAVTASYELQWNTRRSEAECLPLTEYAPPGDYRVTAAAYGGEPADLVFDLLAPAAPAPEHEPDAEKLPGKQEKQEKRSETQRSQG